MYKYLLLSFLLLSLNLKGAYIIEGELVDSKNAYSVVQLSFISSIDKLQTADNRNVINEVRIDSLGRFKMIGNDLPDEDALYRLSLVDGFSATSIKTGARRSFNLLVINNSSVVFITDCDDVSVSFCNCEIKGSSKSVEIQSFYDDILPRFYKDGTSEPDRISETKVEFLKKKYLSEFRNYSDTSTNLIPSLVAYQLSQNFEDERINDNKWNNSFLEKVIGFDSENSYVKDLEFILAAEQGMQYKLENSALRQYLLVFGGLALITLLFCFFLLFKLKKYRSQTTKNIKNSIENLKNTLSNRESEVLHHIESGKTNKEIAQAMFIEVSTVKSQQTKIFQKLGVKSRNELLK